MISLVPAAGNVHRRMSHLNLAAQQLPLATEKQTNADNPSQEPRPYRRARPYRYKGLSTLLPAMGD